MASINQVFLNRTHPLILYPEALKMESKEWSILLLLENSGFYFNVNLYNIYDAFTEYNQSEIDEWNKQKNEFETL